MSDTEKEMTNIRSDTRIFSLLANLSGVLAEHSRLAERICKAVAEKFFPERIFFFTALGALHDIGDLVLPGRVIFQEQSGARHRDEEEHTTAVRAGYLFLRSIHPDLADLILHHHKLQEYAAGNIDFPDPQSYPNEIRVIDIVSQNFSTEFIMLCLDLEEKKILGLAITAIEAMMEHRKIDDNLAMLLTERFPQFPEMQKFISELLAISTS